MDLLIDFYLASGERHPDEVELQKRPTARLVAVYIKEHKEFLEGKVSAKFTYPETGNDGTFLLEVSENDRNMHEDPNYAGSATGRHEKVSKCVFETEDETDELKESIRVFVKDFADTLAFWRS